MIQHDQVRFILRIQGWFNIQKSINIIYYFNRLKEKNNVIISMNVAKTLNLTIFKTNLS